MLHLLFAFLACQRGVVRVGDGCGLSSSCSSSSIKAGPPPQLFLRALINQRPANKARNDASLHLNPQDDQEDTVTLDDEIRDFQKQLVEVEEDMKQITAAIQSKEEEMSGVQVKIDETGREMSGVQVKIDKVDPRISGVQVEIDKVNVEIEECKAALKSDSISETERSILLQEKQSLRDKEARLAVEKQSLRVEKQSLLDEKTRLAVKEQSLIDKEARLGVEKQSLINKEARLGEEKRLLRSKVEVATPVDEKRVADIDFRVKEESLKHSFDLNQFKTEVNQLFTWFEKDGKVREKIKAPYLPLVQSSGMGKTKLLYETNQFFNSDKDKHVKSLLILCLSGSKQNTKQPDIYSRILLVERSATESTRDSITEQLDNVVKNVTTGKVVLFFDEAQHLLQNDAFGFRCVRWWLRRNDRTSIQVAAVFAGTSSGLANYFKDDHQPSQNTRYPKAPYYESGNKGFDPFFRLFTIGLFVKPQSPINATATDYDIAVPYGRPLFALLHNKSQLNESKEMTIFDRMTLSEKEWNKNDLACLSLLGTRVQMGQTSLSVASHLVKEGYACLTYFSEPAKMAQIAFMPDPVCARLAMCAMDPNFQSDNIKGLEKDAWSRNMTKIVSTGLCHPHKGNLGEVASALYLLFCGDLLRARIDPSYRCFQVPLESFLSVAFNPNQTLPSLTADTKLPHVSFIQVCRNHARVSAKNRFSRTSMEWMYNAACACYCYEGCPAIDWFAPVRVVDMNDKEKVSFVPLVVSVKARLDFSSLRVRAAFQSMQKELRKGKQKAGVCILFLIGLDKPEKFTSGFYNVTKTKCDPIPEQKCDFLSNSILNVLVCAGANNSFGLFDVVTQTTTDGDERAEVYTSHGLLRGLPTEKNCRSSTVLRKKSKTEIKKYLRELRKAYQDIDKPQQPL